MTLQTHSEEDTSTDRPVSFTGDTTTWPVGRLLNPTAPWSPIPSQPSASSP